MDNTIDPQVKNLVTAIGQAETGENNPNAYTEKGASGEFGRYQYMPDTWKMWAGEQLGDEKAPMTVENQNKVAYNKVKQWKEQGLTPAQIASKWNSGDENAYKTQTPGKNSMGVSYDTPAYTMKVSKNYKKLSGGGGITATAQAAEGPETAQPQKSLGMKVLDFLGTITGQKGLGEDIGGGLAHSYAKKQYQEAVDSWSQVTDSLKQKIADLKTKGEDTSHLEGVLKTQMDSIPDPSKFLPDVDKKTAEQIIGDIGQSALGFSGIFGAEAGLATKGLSTGEKILQGAKVGAAYGAAGSGLGAMQDNKDAGQVGLSALEGGAIGAGLGGAVSGVVAGVGAGIKGIVSKISGKTAEQVMATAPEDVAKLSASERKYYYQNKQAEISKQYSETEAGIKQDVIQKTQQAKDDIQSLSKEVTQAADKESTDLKAKIMPKLSEQSQTYGKMVEEELAPHENESIFKNEISQFIDSQHAEDPDLAKSIKDQLGLTDTTPKVDAEGNTIPEKPTTVGEIYSQMKKLRSGISSAANKGSRVFTPNEYMTDKATNDLVQFLDSKGVDLSGAKQFWAEWAPVRDRIVRETRLFDMSGTKEVGFINTLKKMANGKATPTTERFVKTIEDLIGEPLGSETKAAMNKLTDRQKERIAEKISTQMELQSNKEAKREAMGEFKQYQFDTERSAARKKMILKILGVAGVAIGAPKLLKVLTGI